MSPLTEKMTTIFHDVFDDDTIVLRRDLTAADVAEWDSLSHVRLILSIQKAFGVKFSAAQAANLKNVGELMDLVTARTGIQ